MEGYKWCSFEVPLDDPMVDLFMVAINRTADSAIALEQLMQLSHGRRVYIKCETETHGHISYALNARNLHLLHTLLTTGTLPDEVTSSKMADYCKDIIQQKIKNILLMEVVKTKKSIVYEDTIDDLTIIRREVNVAFTCGTTLVNWVGLKKAIGKKMYIITIDHAQYKLKYGNVQQILDNIKPIDISSVSVTKK